MKKPKNLTVLVVEDDAGSRFVLEIMLSETLPNAKAVFLKSAEEALKHLEAEDVDIILSDCFLRGKMTGIDLWQKVRALEDRPKFILVSGADPSRIFPKDLKHRPKLLSKPFSKEAMQEALDSEDSNGSN